MAGPPWSLDHQPCLASSLPKTPELGYLIPAPPVAAMGREPCPGVCGRTCGNLQKHLSSKQGMQCRVVISEAQVGDVLAIYNAGAYGFSMSNNYNSRCRPAEVLYRKGKGYPMRKRETIEDITRNEILLD